MKFCIIFLPLPFSWKPVAPPILEYLDALTRRLYPFLEIKLISACVKPYAFDTMECDLAAISVVYATSLSLAAYWDENAMLCSRLRSCADYFPLEGNV